MRAARLGVWVEGRSQLSFLTGGIDAMAQRCSGADRMALTSFTDRIRNAVAAPITAVGNIDGPANAVVLADRENLGRRVDLRLAGPCGIPHARAALGDRRLAWPTSQCAVGDQLCRLAARCAPATGKA